MAIVRKKSATAVKQEVQAALQDVASAVAERREAGPLPAERVERRAAEAAIAAADSLTLENVVKDITQLRSSVGKTLSQIAESLEGEVVKYQQVKKAIEVKEKELAEVYDIQRQAVTLAAMLEAQQRKREEFEQEVTRARDELAKEMGEARGEWDRERLARELASKEQQAADAKRRVREQEEYQYKLVREQQLARDQFADEKAKLERDIALRRETLERELSEREAAVAAREKRLDELEKHVAGIPAEVDAAVAKAVKEAVGRAQSDAGAREELLKREFIGEKNVQAARIAGLEAAVKDQAEQIRSLTAKLEKAYGQVQEVAVRAIDGSSQVKAFAGLQQALSEQSRKSE